MNNHMTSRAAAVAGSFYPQGAADLQRQVQQLLEQVSNTAPTPTPTPAPKVLIVPHAGYMYSGATAAAAYQRLNCCADTIKKVVVLGPSHRVALRGIASPGCDSFSTPLGEIALDLEGLHTCEQLPFVAPLPQAHALEHSIEVQLPFLQVLLGSFSLLPLVVGETTPEQVAQLLRILWGQGETLIVISTDLSHFHSYEQAQKIDRDSAEQIKNFRYPLSGQQACGCRPLNGLLLLAKKKQLQVEQLALCNSYDSAKADRNRVVGYGAFSLN